MSDVLEELLAPYSWFGRAKRRRAADEIIELRCLLRDAEIYADELEYRLDRLTKPRHSAAGIKEDQ